MPRPSGEGRRASRRVSSGFDEFSGDDEFGGLDDFGYEDHDDFGYGQYDSPPRTPRSPGRRSSKRRRKGMPASVMVAVAGESVLIPINVLTIVGCLIALNCGAVVISALRIGFEVACIVGYFRKQSQARWASIVLSAIGIVFLGLLLVLILGTSVMAERLQGGVRTFAIVNSLFQIAVFGTLIVSLLMPSAARHFDS